MINTAQLRDDALLLLDRAHNFVDDALEDVYGAAEDAVTSLFDEVDARLGTHRVQTPTSLADLWALVTDGIKISDATVTYIDPDLALAEKIATSDWAASSEWAKGGAFYDALVRALNDEPGYDFGFWRETVRDHAKHAGVS